MMEPSFQQGLPRLLAIPQTHQAHTHLRAITRTFPGTFLACPHGWFSLICHLLREATPVPSCWWLTCPFLGAAWAPGNSHTQGFTSQAVACGKWLMWDLKVPYPAAIWDSERPPSTKSPTGPWGPHLLCPVVPHALAHRSLGSVPQEASCHNLPSLFQERFPSDPLTCLSFFIISPRWNVNFMTVETLFCSPLSNWELAACLTHTRCSRTPCG